MIFRYPPIARAGFAAAWAIFAAAPAHRALGAPDPAGSWSAASGSAPAASTSAPASKPTPAKAHPGDRGEAIEVRAASGVLNVQKTPTSVSVITAAELDHVNATSLSDLNGLAPGLNIVRTSGYQTNIQIRGVGTQTPENTLATSTGVAVYVDGVYIANSVSLDQTFLDLDTIDVYRGPQATRYGQSAPGGAIVLRTHDPSFDRLSGKLETSGGTYDLARGRAQVNVPLARNLAIRMSVQSFGHAGFGHTSSPDLGRYGLDDAQDTSGRIAIRWQPAPQLTATLTGQWANATPHGAEQKNILDPDPDPRAASQDYPARSALATTFYHLNLDWRTPYADIGSITATQSVSDHVQYDNARLAQRIFGRYDILPSNDNSLNNYSETLTARSRMASVVSWETGIVLMAQRGHSYLAEFGGTDPVAWPDFPVPGGLEHAAPADLTYGNQVTANRIAVQPFLDLDVRLTDRLHLRGGARLNDERNDLSARTFSAFGGAVSHHVHTDRIPTWKISLERTLSRPSVGIESLLYFSIATGDKPGGVNGNPTAKVVPSTFRAERLTNEEIGVKTWLSHHRLMIDLAAFHASYRHMQFIADDPYPFAYGVDNVPDVRLYGIEMEDAYRAPGDRLRIDASLTLENSVISSDFRTLDASAVAGAYASAAPCADGGQYYNPACWAAVEARAVQVRGNRAPGMPTVQGRIALSYAWDVPGGTLATNGQYVYRGPYQSRVFNDPRLDRVPAYFTLDAFAQYQPIRAAWSVSIAATNLTDKAGVNARFTDPYGSFQTSEQFIAPRQVVGTLGYAF